jgi:hypothetical protein
MNGIPLSVLSGEAQTQTIDDVDGNYFKRPGTSQKVQEFGVSKLQYLKQTDLKDLQQHTPVDEQNTRK